MAQVEIEKKKSKEKSNKIIDSNGSTTRLLKFKTKIFRS